MTYYVTFGQRYRIEPHPILSNAHPDGWVEVESDSEADARRLTFHHLKNRWAFMYRADEFIPDLHDRGCIARINEADGLIPVEAS